MLHKSLVICEAIVVSHHDWRLIYGVARNLPITEGRRRLKVSAYGRCGYVESLLQSLCHKSE